MLAKAASDLLDFAVVSHLGHVRQRNQDSCHIAPERGLAIVADGVGGQGDGAWASQRAVELFVHRFAALNAATGAEDAVRDILQAVHAQMLDENQAHEGKPSGTTIAGIWAPLGSAGPMTVFNVGDSSVFRLSYGKMTKLSHDHSLHQLWRDGGCVGREPAKRMIVQALGISEQVTPHLTSVQVRKGDTVLICTDGLTSALPLERLAVLLAKKKSSQSTCDLLLQDALAGPAADNVTVSVCCF